MKVEPATAQVMYSSQFGWHMPCTAEGCVWRWELRGEDDTEEIERGQEMHRAHHAHDHPLDLSEFE